MFVLENELRDFDDGLRRVKQRLSERRHGDRVGEAAVDVDRLLAAHADVHSVGTVEGEVKSGPGQELTQRGVVGIEADNGVANERGQRFGWDLQLERYAALLAVLVERRVERTLGNPKTSNR